MLRYRIVAYSYRLCSGPHCLVRRPLSNQTSLKQLRLQLTSITTNGSPFWACSHLRLPTITSRFEDYFANRVKQLTFTFPEDAVTSNGSPFWSAPKRFPRPLEYDTSDPSHVSFVQSGAILRAETYGLKIPDWARDAEK